MNNAGNNTFSDLQGASRLAIDAVTSVTGIVEDLHRNISGLAPVVGKPPTGRTKGITGLVYRSVRGVTRVAGFGLDTVRGQLTPLLRNIVCASRERAQRGYQGLALGQFSDAVHQGHGSAGAAAQGHSILCDCGGHANSSGQNSAGAIGHASQRTPAR